MIVTLLIVECFIRCMVTEPFYLHGSQRKRTHHICISKQTLILFIVLPLSVKDKGFQKRSLSAVKIQVTRKAADWPCYLQQRQTSLNYFDILQSYSCTLLFVGSVWTCVTPVFGTRLLSMFCAGWYIFQLTGAPGHPEEAQQMLRKDLS